MGFSLVFNVNAMLIGPFDRHKHDLDAVLNLLAMAVGRSTPDRLRQLLDEFHKSDGHTLYVASQNDVISGIIGVDCIAKPRGVITHIAVLPDRRMKGIGRNLIVHAIETFKLADIAAETDQRRLRQSAESKNKAGRADEAGRVARGV